MIQWIKDHNPPFHLHFLLAMGVINLAIALTTSTLPWLSGMSAGWCFGLFLAMYNSWRLLEHHNRVLNELFLDVDRLTRYQIQKQKAEYEQRVTAGVSERLREINGEYTVNPDDRER